MTQIVVRLGVADALPVGTILSIDGKDGEGSGRFAEVNLNGFSQQLAGLTNTPRNLRIQRIVNSNVSAAATLTVNNSGDFTFSGSLGGGAVGSVSPSSTPGSTDGNNFALTKGGAGLLQLTGSLSYSGNTIVNQGILSLGSANPNNETSTVIIAATGAKLDLAFQGTDTVNELFIGDALMPAGVYEAVGNPGNGIEIAEITGTGTLTVSTGYTPPLVGYDAWKSNNGTNQPIDGDHDGDGVPNGIEHFLGGDENTTGFTPLPDVTGGAGALSVTWTKGAGYTGGYGTHFTVETAFNFKGVWTTETAAPEPGATVTFPTPDTVRYTFPASAGRKKFVRLRVAAP
jgi:autotransporter-associated beta strand protein